MPETKFKEEPAVLLYVDVMEVWWKFYWCLRQSKLLG